MKAYIDFDKRTRRIDGTYPLAVRLRNGSKRKYIKIGISILENQFKNGLVINHPNKGELNKKIRRAELKIRQILDKFPQLSIEKFIFYWDNQLNTAMHRPPLQLKYISWEQIVL